MIAIASLAAAHLASCGYIGDPLPPSLEIPVAVNNLQVSQVGDQLLISFTLPTKSTENLILKNIEQTEFRAGPAGAGEFNAESWAASAARFEVPAAKDGVVRMELPIKDWVARNVVTAVRTQGAKLRYSAWSNIVVTPVVAALQPPSMLTAEARADGVALKWQAVEGAEYRIFRGASQLAASTAAQYADTTAEFGKPYTYQVQAYRKLNDKQAAESLLSKAVEITPKDTFPPAAPSGLQLIQGVGSIEITWNRSTEADWKAYKLWRAEGDAPFQLLAADLTQISYSDRSAARGKKYRYAVSSLDNAGNESEKSQPQEFTLPE